VIEQRKAEAEAAAALAAPPPSPTIDPVDEDEIDTIITSPEE